MQNSPILELAHNAARNWIQLPRTSGDRSDPRGSILRPRRRCGWIHTGRSWRHPKSVYSKSPSERRSAASCTCVTTVSAEVPGPMKADTPTSRKIA
jgi:hypothetical protein